MACTDHYCLASPDEEIRLLDLLPVTSTGKLSGRLKRVRIDNTPPFVAVSHVWGDGKADVPMGIASGCGSRTVTISPNLESFILSLFCHGSSSLPELWKNGVMMPLWVDMICINQDDNNEKARQIPLMRQIYSRAQCVIIWINESDSRLRYAFKYLRRLLKGTSSTDRSNVGALFEPMGWDALKHLLSCDWFHRRWVAQEMILPRQAVFLCGSDMMRADDLLNGVTLACKALGARPGEMKKASQAVGFGSIRSLIVLKELRQHIRKSKTPPRLFWLLTTLRSTRTTIPHDQIYGLLGLCDPEEASRNPIRYGVGPEEVFKTAVKVHVELYKNVQFLAFCTPLEGDCIDIQGQTRPWRAPSWVPNWSSDRFRKYLGDSMAGHSNVFATSGRVRPKSTFKGNELIVYGTRIDEVAAMISSRAVSQEETSSDWNLSLFEQYIDFWATSTSCGDGSPYNHDVDRAEAIARTLSFLGVDLKPMPDPKVIPTMFYRFWKNSKVGKQLAALGLESRLVKECKESFSLMKCFALWKPVTTKRGYIGLVRESCAVGSEIWAIAGSSVPIALSRATSGQHLGKPEVRGEVFMDGFMFGEIFKGPTGNVPKLEKVTLA